MCDRLAGEEIRDRKRDKVQAKVARDEMKAMASELRFSRRWAEDFVIIGCVREQEREFQVALGEAPVLRV